LADGVNVTIKMTYIGVFWPQEINLNIPE
jgi:hypothetical protein